MTESMPHDAASNRARRVELILQRVESLPTLSPVASRILKLTSVSDPALAEIIPILEADPALSARVISLSRRASLGLGSRVSSVKQAVVMLGLDAIQAALLSISVYDVLDEARRSARTIDDPEGSHPRDAFDAFGFWRHCIAVACASELIAETHPARGVRREEAFIAGLIHDLGKIVLHMLLPRAYARVVGLVEAQQSAAAPIERAILGLDHHTAGKRLAEHWELPHPLLDVIWLHSQPYHSLPDLPHKGLIANVSVAKALCRKLHVGWSGEASPLPDLAAICRESGFNLALVEGCAGRLADAVAARCAALGLEDKPTVQILLESITAANARLGKMTHAMQAKSRDAAAHARIIQAITLFHAQAARSRGLVDTLTLVAASAADLLGQGFLALLLQPRPDDPWNLCVFSPRAELLRHDLIDSPQGRSEGRGALAALARPAEVSVASLGLVPWLADHLTDSTDIRDIKLLPLGPILEDAGPACIMLHDRPLPAEGNGRIVIEALTASWGAAVAASNQHDGARRLGERLAEATRALIDTQTRLEDAQVMVRLGRLAAGAAHEMNNPLTIISGRTQQLLAAASDPAVRPGLQAIADAAEHLSDLITSLHTIADPPQPNPMLVSLRSLAEAAIESAETRTRQPGRTHITISQSPETISVDAALLTSAISELIANSLESATDCRVHLSVRCIGHELEVVVTDTGPGMSAKALRHAFDPFFSERPAGRKTGLGLTRARRLIEVHGGTLLLASTVGQGTTATVRVPFSADARDRDAHAPSQFDSEARAA